MTGFAEMLLTASLVCGAAALCLTLLPNALPRVRFRIALAGLAAWAVPWPMLSIPLELPAPSALIEWSETLARIAPADDAAAASVTQPYRLPADPSADGPLARGQDAGRTGSVVAGAAHRSDAAARVPERMPASSAAARTLRQIPAGLVLVVLFLPGLVCFARDAAALRAALRAWQAASSSGEALRAGLPAELRDVRASIRIVPGSAIAATSGWLRPVVWLGDRLADRDREVALVHELCHVRRRDPLFVTFVTAMRRAYWWNPVVAWLGREAVLAMESDCDRRCTGWFGVEAYVERLAAMMLDAVTPPAPRLLAHARTPNLNVRRLKLLESAAPRMRSRDHLLVAIMALLAVGSATYALAKPAGLYDPTRTPPVEGTSPANPSRLDPARGLVDESMGMRPDWSRVPIPETPAGHALRALVDAFNAGDAERLAVLLGAFTPQELEFDVPSSSGGLDLVAILASEPLEIEYVAEDRHGGVRRRGVLEVHAWDSSRIASLEVLEQTDGDLR